MRVGRLQVCNVCTEPVIPLIVLALRSTGCMHLLRHTNPCLLNPPSSLFATAIISIWKSTEQTTRGSCNSSRGIFIHRRAPALSERKEWCQRTQAWSAMEWFYMGSHPKIRASTRTTRTVTKGGESGNDSQGRPSKGTAKRPGTEGSHSFTGIFSTF